MHVWWPFCSHAILWWCRRYSAVSPGQAASLPHNHCEKYCQFQFLSKPSISWDDVILTSMPGAPLSPLAPFFPAVPWKNEQTNTHIHRQRTNIHEESQKYTGLCISLASHQDAYILEDHAQNYPIILLNLAATHSIPDTVLFSPLHDFITHREHFRSSVLFLYNSQAKQSKNINNC